MDLRQLQTFEAIIATGSYVKAAEALQYAQPTITLHMHQLEATLGVKLFARKGRSMQLTPAGRMLHEQAGVLLRHADTTRQMLADLVAGEAGHVRLGAIEPAASLHLPAILMPYCELHPKVRLSLEVANSTTLCERVAAGQLDAAIAAAPPAGLSLVFIPLFLEPLTLLVPENHPLADQVTVTLADVARHRILLSERTCAYRQLVERAIVQHGASPYATMELGSLGLVKQGVQDGLGVAILPESIVTPPPEGTRVRALEGERIALTVGLVVPDREDALYYRAVHEVLAQLATRLAQEGYFVPKRLRSVPALEGDKTDS